MNYAIIEEADGKWKIICYKGAKRIGVPVYCNTWDHAMLWLSSHRLTMGVAA